MIRSIRPVRAALAVLLSGALLCAAPIPTVQKNAGITAAAAESLAVWDGTADTAWFDEEMTSFTLSTPEELAGLAALVNDGRTMQGIAFRLGADMDLGGSEETPWPGIGTGTGVQFCGALYGAGHTISGLCQTGDVQTAGLLGVLGKGGQVRDLTLRGCTVTSSRTDTASFAGTVAGYTMEGASVHDCTAVSCTVSGTYFAGGICGRAGGDLFDCTCEGVQVSGSAYAGGIAASTKPPVSGCTASGMVQSTSEERFVGGIIGTAEGSVLNCTSQCVVTGGLYTGGIVGYTIADVSGCRSFGPVSSTVADAMTGGIVGVQKYGTVKSCTNYAGVTDSGNAACAGGIVGYAQGAVLGCVNRAGVMGVKYTGGIAGYATDTSSITSCGNEASLGTACTAGEHYIGGIAGDSRGAIYGSINTADFTVKLPILPEGTVPDLRVGGIAGQSLGEVRECTQSGSITMQSDGAYARVGGIVGVAAEGFLAESDYSTGDLHAEGFTEGLNAGGIVGICTASAQLTGVYSAGDIEASGGETTCVKGGIIGAVLGDAAPVLTAAYYRSTTASHGIGNAPEGGGIAKSETNMRTADFAGALGAAFRQYGEEYPVLTWMCVPDLDLDAAQGVSDIVLLQKYVAHRRTLSAWQYARADLNGDGAVNVVDLTMYKQLLLRES